MNLEQAHAMSQLSQPAPLRTLKDTLTATQVAYRILARCEAGGYPYKNFPVSNKGAKAWAKKFLTSQEFKLMHVNLNAAASPHQPRDPKRVKIYAAGDPKTYDPIVIDVNRRQEGSSHLGFVPDVIVVDGKHRKAGILAQGGTHHWAWVGRRAVKKMKPRDVKAAEEVLVPECEGSPIAVAYELFAATIPAVRPMGKTAIRQDTGSGGNRPVDHMHGEKKVEECNACGAASSGSLNPPSASDISGQDISDAAGDASSDKRTWNPDKPNFAPSINPDNAKQFGLSKQAAYMNNTGPRIINKGGSRSEMSRNLHAKAGHRMTVPNMSRQGKGVGHRTTVPNMTKGGTGIGHRLTVPSFEEEMEAKAGHRMTVPNMTPQGKGVGHRTTVPNMTKGGTGIKHRLTVPKFEAEKHIDKMYHKKKKKMEAEAPPGREDQVMELKKHFPKGSGSPFAIAWDSYNKKKKGGK